MNLNDFDKQARDANKQVVAEATETIRAVALDLFYSLQTRAKDAGGQSGSPVASGRLVASYRLSINSIDTSAEPEDSRYRYPSATVHKYDADNLPRRTIRNRPISRTQAALRSFRLGDKIFVSNSVPYIRRIELGGHSWQTPGGPVETSVRAVVRRFANVNLKVRYV